MKPDRPDFKAIAQEISAERADAAAKALNRLATVAAVASPAAIVMAAPAAEAQSIDYGSLESLFGEPVTTSATGAPQRSSEAPVSMEIISAEDIKNSGAADLPTLLSRLPGVNVQRSARSATDVAVRGYNQEASPRLLVLVNGRQVYQDFYGLTDWGSIPVQLSEIRQIEVVKGPNSALFGFNAVGGVVNIITFNPLYDDADTVTTRIYNDGSSDASVVTTFKPTDKIGVRLSAGGFSKDEFDGQDVFDTTEKMAYSGEVKVQIAPKVQATLEGTQSNLRALEPQGLSRDTVYDWDNKSVRGTIEAEGGFGLLNITAYQNKADVLLDKAASNSSTLNSQLDAFKVEDLFKIGAKHTFRVAAEHRKSSMDFATSSLGNSTVETKVDALSAMWNWAINDKLASTLAVRGDKLTVEGQSLYGRIDPAYATLDDDSTEVSYNAGLVWKATDKDTLKFQLARGVQTPSQIDFWKTPMIESSFVQNYAVDYERPVEAIGGDFTASVFYQVNEDMRAGILAEIAPGVVFPLVQNWGDSEEIGVELSLRGQIGENFSWYGSYTHLEVEDDPAPTSYRALYNLSYVNYEESTPADEVKLGGLYSAGKWQFGADARYVSDRKVPMEGATTGSYVLADIDGYVGLDARAAYKVTDGVVLALEGQDITNDDDIQVPGARLESQYRLALRVDF